MIWADIRSDGDLTFKRFHEDGIFIEALHIHLFDSIELVIFEVSYLKNLSVASLSEEYSFLPFKIISVGKIILLHNTKIITFKTIWPNHLKVS